MQQLAVQILAAATALLTFFAAASSEPQPLSSLARSFASSRDSNNSDNDVVVVTGKNVGQEKLLAGYGAKNSADNRRPIEWNDIDATDWKGKNSSDGEPFRESKDEINELVSSEPGKTTEKSNNGSLADSFDKLLNETNSSSVAANADDGGKIPTPSSVELLNAILQCFKSTYILTCFNQKIVYFIKWWRQNNPSLLKAYERPGNSNRTVAVEANSTAVPSATNGSSFMANIGKTMYQGFSNLLSVDDDQLENKAREDSGSTGINDYFNDLSDTFASGKEERGHHKKKKVQKEIKKLILKIILGIFLFKLKIKMILSMIQSILVSKLIFAATLYVLTLTFKVWYEIKQSKLHAHDKHIVYYDNTHAHHEHSYDLPDHGDYDESYSSPLHHGSSSDSSWGLGSFWGRSLPEKRTAVPINKVPTTTSNYNNINRMYQYHPVTYRANVAVPDPIRMLDQDELT